jgi:hypothetical protein
VSAGLADTTVLFPLCSDLLAIHSFERQFGSAQVNRKEAAALNPALTMHCDSMVFASTDRFEVADWVARPARMSRREWWRAHVAPVGRKGIEELKPRTQKRCIFCGRKPTTKEHIWSDWMHPYLPMESNARIEVNHTVAQHDSPRGRPPVSRERPGPVITKQIRIVCGNCNNGWMSRLETQVKPIILPMIQGTGGALDAVSQELLARWISMKAIVTEYSQHAQRLTPSDDRAALMNNYEIPRYFFIRVGRNASQWRMSFMRHSTSISITRPPIAPQMAGTERNIGQITLMFDALVIQVLAVRVPGYRIEHRITPQVGVQLWPIQNPTLDFGKQLGIDDDQLIACTHSLRAFVDVNMRGWAPMPNAIG